MGVWVYLGATLVPVRRLGEEESAMCVEKFRDVTRVFFVVISSFLRLLSGACACLLILFLPFIYFGYPL